jgi:hypothetical protein
MGMLSRALVPRGVRRAAHPVRTAKSAVTPRVVKQARNVLNPIDSARYYGVERPLNTKPRKRRKGSHAAASDTQMGFEPGKVARWVEEVLSGAGHGVLSDAVCEPNPDDAWKMIVTGFWRSLDGSETAWVAVEVQCYSDGRCEITGNGGPV